MNNNTFSRWKESLHLKILSGYLILGLLVLGIITAVWYEKQVFEQAEAEERSLLMQRAAASEAYRGLHIPEHTRSLSGNLLGYKTIP